MIAVHTVDQVRAAERATGDLLASGALMERAAGALALAVRSELAEITGRRRGRVLVAVGPGDNGGDGLFAAARLASRGCAVSAWRTSDRVHAAGWDAFRLAGGREVDAVGAVAMLADVDLVVDAVFGIGARGGLPPAVEQFAEACDALGVPVVACDLPSGLTGDGCEDTGSFRAVRTVSFGAWKPCQWLEPARSRCGARTLIDIGLDLPRPALVAWQLADLAAAWPWPGPTSDKYSRGVVGIDTGSPGFPGAAVLSVGGASYSGAGMVRYLGPAAGAVVAAHPDVVTVDGRVQAHLVGSGWGRGDWDARLQGVLAQGLPTVVDADAIAAVTRPVTGSDVLLTPHAGELARLLDRPRAEVTRDPVRAVLDAVDRTGATVLLKGATQYVATPGDPVVRLALPGPAWTARAGSGDTLAGICVTLLGAGLPAPTAALAAASVQALAAVRSPGPHPPADLARTLPAVIASLRD